MHCCHVGARVSDCPMFGDLMENTEVILIVLGIIVFFVALEHGLISGALAGVWWLIKKMFKLAGCMILAPFVLFQALNKKAKEIVDS